MAKSKTPPNIPIVYTSTLYLSVLYFLSNKNLTVRLNGAINKCLKEKLAKYVEFYFVDPSVVCFYFQCKIETIALSNKLFYHFSAIKLSTIISP